MSVRLYVLADAAHSSTSDAATGPRGALHAGGAVVRVGVEGGGARHRPARRRPLLRRRRGGAGPRSIHAVGGARPGGGAAAVAGGVRCVGAALAAVGSGQYVARVLAPRLRGTVAGDVAGQE